LGEDWTEMNTFDNTLLGINDSQYFQYKAEIASEDLNSSPGLFNVSIEASEINDTLISVNIDKAIYENYLQYLEENGRIISKDLESYMSSLN
jgi:hypothetical protein